MPKDIEPAAAGPEVLLTPDVARAALVLLGRITNLHFTELEAAMRVKAALEAIARQGAE